jgi:hypothetical protein
VAAIKLLARDWKFYLNTGTVAAPIWTQIKGINTWGLSSSKGDVDTTDFDSDGTEEHMVASRGLEQTLSGHLLEDPDNGDRDPGQEAVEALAKLKGHESLKQLKTVSKGGTVNIGLVSADAAAGGGGGGNDDTVSWEAKFKYSGPVVGS